MKKFIFNETALRKATVAVRRAEGKAEGCLVGNSSRNNVCKLLDGCLCRDVAKAAIQAYTNALPDSVRYSLEYEKELKKYDRQIITGRTSVKSPKTQQTPKMQQRIVKSTIQQRIVNFLSYCAPQAWTVDEILAKLNGAKPRGKELPFVSRKAVTDALSRLRKNNSAVHQPDKGFWQYQLIL